MSEAQSKLLVGDVARHFDKSPDTIRLWCRLGWIKAERTASGVRLFDRSEVERVARWLDGRCRQRSRP